MANRNVSFYGPSRGVLGGSPIQRDYQMDPRRAMAQQLMQQGTSTAPVQSPLEGLTRALTAGVGGYYGNQAREEMQGREGALNQDMLKVLAGGQQQPMPLPQGVQGPPAMSPGGYEGMQQALGGVDNPDLAPFAQQIGMQQMQQEQAARQAEIARTQGFEDYRKKKDIGKEYAPALKRETIKGPDGRNYYVDDGTPVLPDVKTPQETFLEMLEPPAEPIGDVGGMGADPFDTTVTGVPEDAEVQPGTFSPEGGQQPSVREIFNSLPQEAQIGIKTSQDPMKAFSSYLLKSKGMDIQFGPDGTISSISQGGQSSQWGTKATGTIQEKLFNAREGLARIGGIEQSMRPEFLETGTRLGAAWSGLKESMGVDLDPQDKATLADFSTFKMNSIENINRYIKEITGAQMSEAEAVRLRQGMPDPGDSWYNGDSPTQFDSKLKGQTRQLRSAAARYQYGLKNGWDMDTGNLEKSLPLNKVESLIEERGSALERQIRARRPELGDQEIEGFVMQTLNAEFGVGQ